MFRKALSEADLRVVDVNFYVKTTLLIFVLGIIIGIGCASASSDPTIPSPPINDVFRNPPSGSGRVLWGMWSISFDPVALTADAEPVRDAQGHFDITGMLFPPSCNDCLKLNMYSFDPVTRVLEMGITLRNPTHMKGYDVRGILYTNDLGHRLLNPDAWTDLWDIPGGEDLNPFIAFAKSVDKRIFAGQVSHTETYRIHIPQPPMWNSITYAVDASWPENCKEPYAIDNFTQEMIYDIEGSSGNIQLDLFDWQGDISNVFISLPDVTGEEITPMAHTGIDSWSAEIVNGLGAPVGEYPGLITAISNNPGTNILFDYVTVRIIDEDNPFNLTDVTKGWMSFSPWDIVVDGDFAYINATDELQILNISNPYDPSWAKAVMVGEDDVFIQDIEVSGGYAYILSESSVNIYDITQPANAHLISTCPTMMFTEGLCVKDGYAYVSHENKFEIIDIDPPGSCDSIITIDTTGYTDEEIMVEGGYAFVTGPAGFGIIDIDPPESAEMIKTIPLLGDHRNFDLIGDYAYVARSWSIGSPSGGIYVIDINPPITANVETGVLVGKHITDVEIGDEYAYAVDAYLDELWTIDISDPGNPVALGSVYVEYLLDVTVAGDAVYARSYPANLQILGMAAPGVLEEKNFIWGMGHPINIRIKDNYICASEFYGPRFIDFESYDIVGGISGIINTGFGTTWDVNTRDDYAYIAQGGFGLWVADISTNTPEVVLQLPGFVDAREVEIYGDYAFVADYTNSDGVKIVDISDPPNASIVSEMWAMEEVPGMEIVGNILYIVNGNGNFHIYDITYPLEPGSIGAKYLDMPGFDVSVHNGMAYVACETALKIIDVDPPENASIVKTVDVFDEAHSVAAMDGYVFITDRESGVHIIDVDPVEDASIIYTLDWLTFAEEVEVSADHLYVADMYAGLRVYRLY